MRRFYRNPAGLYPAGLLYIPDYPRRKFIRGGAHLGAFAPSFTPADLTDLVFWMDPTQNVTEDTGGVSQWDEAAGVDISFTQGTSGQRPDVTTLNSLNIIDFTEANSDVLNSASITYSIGTGDFYSAALFNTDTVTGENIIASVNTTDWNILEINGDTPAMWTGVGFHSFASLAGIATGTTYILEYWRSGTSLRCRLNDVLDTDSQTTSADLGSANTFVIGANSNANNLFFDGRIGDVILQQAFDQTEADNTRDYLADKWGVSI